MKNSRLNYGAGMLRVLVQHCHWLEAQGPSYKLQAASCKLQASSLKQRLTTGPGDDRMYLERNNYET